MTDRTKSFDLATTNRSVCTAVHMSVLLEVVLQTCEISEDHLQSIKSDKN